MSFWNWLKARFKRHAVSRAEVAPPPADAQVVAIINRSSIISDDSLAEMAAALQVQVTRDFIPHWLPGKAFAIIAIGKNEDAPQGAWQIVVLNNSDIAGDLGYHEMTEAGRPLGKVFAADDVMYGAKVSVTISHELLEMIGDPDAEETRVGPNARLYAYEACDPVEDEAYGYTINDVLVSDFVLPAYFIQGVDKPFDFCGHVRQPYEILDGGYLCYFDGSDWKQQRGRRVYPESPCRREFKDVTGCRCWRRKIGRKAWRHSSPRGKS